MKEANHYTDELKVVMIARLLEQKHSCKIEKRIALSGYVDLPMYYLKLYADSINDLIFPYKLVSRIDDCYKKFLDEYWYNILTLSLTTSSKFYRKSINKIKVANDENELILKAIIAGII